MLLLVVQLFIWILLDQNEPHLATSYKPFNKDIPPPPSRESLIGNLKKVPQFDVLVIGGVPLVPVLPSMQLHVV